MLAAARLGSVALTVLAAWFAARGLGASVLDAVGSGVNLAGGPQAAAPAPPADASGGLTITRQELLGSNLFALPREPGPALREDPAPQPAALPRFDTVSSPCALPVRVVALVAVRDATSAAGLAAIERPAGTIEYRVGDHLDDAVVTRIARDRVYLRPDGGADDCYLDIRAPAAAATATPSPAPAPAVAPQPSSPAQPQQPAPDRQQRWATALGESIEPAGDGEFTVRRALLTTAMEEPELAMGRLRVLPARDGDAVIGFRFYGVAGDSLAGRLGLQGGDVVTGVNGLPLTGMDAVMRAWGLLRQADDVTVDVLRRGAKRSLVYHLR